MTLLETLIAMSLLSMLLVFVFGIFRELSEVNRLVEKSQKESFHMRYLETRLGFIFERLVNEKASARTFYFYTEPPNRDFTQSTSLIFTFNNDIRFNPALSGDVLGRLYVNSKHELSLAIWPLHVSQPHSYLEEEILFPHVVKVNYHFYAAPQRIQNEKDIVSGKVIDTEKKNPEKDLWHDEEWFMSYKQMPSILKIVLTVAENPQDFKEMRGESIVNTKEIVLKFVLPSSKNPIQYPVQE